MSTVDLGRADLALFSDPVATRVVIPALTAIPARRSRAGTLVQFEGDKFPTGFRGTARSWTFDLTCRFTADQHAELLALLTLIDETAPDSPDSRLLLRTHLGLAPGLNSTVAVQVFDVAPTPAADGPGVFDVQFTATVVNHTLAV